MKRFKFILILVLCLIPFKANAACTSSEKARIKKIISNVNISYDYEIVQGNAIFSIKLSNLNPEIYFMDPFGNTYRTYDSNNNEIVLNNYTDGRSYIFTFYGANSCINQDVGSLYATVPTYNPFYKMSVCNDAKEFSLCQKWVSHSLSRSEFMEKVNEYKENKKLIDDSNVDKKISIIDFAMSFIRMYGIYIAIGIAIIIIVIKVIRYKKDSFGF